MRGTLLLLSKLYRCVDMRIFAGLAQEAVAACTLSVQVGGAAGLETHKHSTALVSYGCYPGLYCCHVGVVLMVRWQWWCLWWWISMTWLGCRVACACTEQHVSYPCMELQC